PSSAASHWTNQRKPTPCTRPLTRKCCTIAPSLHPVNVRSIDKPVSNLLATQAHSRYILRLAKEPAQFAYEWILRRQDHDHGQSVGKLAMQRLGDLFMCSK